MTVDRQAKQKKKREEKRKAYRREMDRLQQVGKAEEYARMAQKAFNEEDYPEPLDFALNEKRKYLVQ
jgi:hypothetical protein